MTATHSFEPTTVSSEHHLQVNDIARMLDLIGRDIPESQQMREFLHNGIQAVNSVGGGKVVIDCQVRFGAQKLAFIDNGVGMTENELRTYVGQLTSSATRVGESRFGIGAKVAGLTNNSLGLEYTTKVAGEEFATRATLGRNFETGQYEWIVGPSGERFEKVKDFVSLISKSGHGTMVVLLGNSQSEDTFSRACGLAPTVRKFETYITEKYAVLPSRIRVSGLLDDSKGGPRRKRQQQALGLVNVLNLATDAHSENRGSVRLPSGVVRWYVSEAKDAKGGAKITRAALRRVVAVCLPDAEVEGLSEIYDLRKGLAGVSVLADFGLAAISSKVALVVEPSGARASTVRDALRDANSREAFDLGTLAQEFRQALPTRLQQLIDESHTQRPVGNDARLLDWNSARPKLKRLSRRGSSISGSALDMVSSPGPQRTRISVSPPPAASRAARRVAVPKQRDVGSSFGVALPNAVRWTEEDFAAEPHLIAYSGRYHAGSNTLYYNEQWATIDQEVEHYARDHGNLSERDRETARRIVVGFTVDRMRDAIMETLCTQAEIPEAFNEEALAASFNEFALSQAARSKLFGLSDTKRKISSELGAFGA